MEKDINVRHTSERMANYLKKAVVGVSAVFIFSFFAMVASYFFRLLLARNLSPEQFGLFYAVFSLMVLIHTFHDPGLKAALIKFIPELIVNQKWTTMNSAISQTLATWLSLSMIFSAGTIIGSSFLATFFFKIPGSEPVIIILSMVFLLQSFEYLTSYILQGFQKMALFASVDFMRMVLLVVFTGVGFVVYGGRVIVPAYAYLITSVIIAVVYFTIIKLKVFVHLNIGCFDRSLFKKMVMFGVPVTLTSMSYSFFQQSSTMFLTYFKSVTDVGLLNVALPTSALLINVSSSIAFVVLPLTAELWAHKYHAHVREGLELLYRFSVIAILPACLVMALFAKLIITLLFGQQYLEAAPALVALSIGTLLWIIANVNFNFLAGIGRSKEPLNLMIVITVGSVILNVLLIPKLGLMGAVYAIIAGYSCACAVSLLMVQKYVQVKIPVWSWFKNLVAGAVFVGAVYGIKYVITIKNWYGQAVLTIVFALAVYCASVFALKITSKKELCSLLGRLRS